MAAREVAADERVRALDLVRRRPCRCRAAARRGGRSRARRRAPAAIIAGELRALDRVGEHVLPVAGAEVQPAEQADELGVEALDVGLEDGLLAALDDVRLELGLRLVVGLLDPRRVDAPVGRSFSSVMRAISRRTPSKPDSTTAFGVSSMMKSTPVRFSSARMLRPSRPMMRPFMSSLGSWTTETVVSARGSPARRCIATDEDVADAAVGVALGLLLDLAQDPRRSWRTSSSTSLSSTCFACAALSPETRSSSRTCCSAPPRAPALALGERPLAVARGRARAGGRARRRAGRASAPAGAARSSCADELRARGACSSARRAGASARRRAAAGRRPLEQRCRDRGPPPARAAAITSFHGLSSLSRAGQATRPDRFAVSAARTSPRRVGGDRQVDAGRCGSERSHRSARSGRCRVAAIGRLRRIRRGQRRGPSFAARIVVPRGLRKRRRRGRLSAALEARRIGRRRRARARSPAHEQPERAVAPAVVAAAAPGSGARAASSAPLRAPRSRPRAGRRPRRRSRGSTPTCAQPALDPLRAPAVELAAVLGEALREAGVVEVALIARARSSAASTAVRPRRPCARGAADLGDRAVAARRGSGRRGRARAGAGPRGPAASRRRQAAACSATSSRSTPADVRDDVRHLRRQRAIAVALDRRRRGRGRGRAPRRPCPRSPSAISGCSSRKALALLRPWPSRSSP